MGLHRLAWVYLETADTNCGSGELLRVAADYTGKEGIMLRCMIMFDGGDTSIFVLVARGECTAT